MEARELAIAYASELWQPLVALLGVGLYFAAVVPLWTPKWWHRTTTRGEG